MSLHLNRSALAYIGTVFKLEKMTNKFPINLTDDPNFGDEFANPINNKMIDFTLPYDKPIQLSKKSPVDIYFKHEEVDLNALFPLFFLFFLFLSLKIYLCYSIVTCK